MCVCVCEREREGERKREKREREANKQGHTSRKSTRLFLPLFFFEYHSRNKLSAARLMLCVFSVVSHLETAGTCGNEDSQSSHTSKTGTLGHVVMKTHECRIRASAEKRKGVTFVHISEQVDFGDEVIVISVSHGNRHHPSGAI
jgi:hypothetical protein